MANTQQHEQTIRLLPGQTTLVFSPRDVINDLIADVDFGYYPGEDTPGGWPFKIILRPSLQTLFEIGFNEDQLRFIIKHFSGLLKTRYSIPHSRSDQNSA